MKRGLGWAAALLGLAAGLGWALAAFAPDGPSSSAALAGALLAGIGGAAGLLWALRAREREKRAFISAVFGGMLFRLLAYGVAVVAVQLVGSWSLVWFVAGVLGAHFVGQVVEVICLVNIPVNEPPEGGAPRA